MTTLNLCEGCDSPIGEEPLSALLIEHSELGRWLDLPGAHLWADQYAAKRARMIELWQEIQARRALSRGNRPSRLEAGATVLPNEQRSAA